MRLPRALLCLCLCLTSPTVLAEPDVFGLGNGQHGALRVQRMDTTINIATALTSTASAGSTSLAVASETGFAAGEIVLVIQMFSESAPPDPPPAGPIELLTTGAGRFEFARLESVSAGALSLTAPLVSSFTAPGSQVVRVPEYTSVHVQIGSALLAAPWNGSSGGVLAFLATDAVLNQGTLSANGAGFRGGTYVGTTRASGCTELHQSEATGGARKGEGLSSLVPGVPTHGYGALANGAGGGNCEDGGGGGGGHGGMGGQGGYTTTTDGARDVGGRGGAALSYSPLQRLVFGGGGGAGAGGSSGGTSSGGSSGGAGGGIIYFRARDLQGSQGRIQANGLSAVAAGNDGAGGGGAGGSISVRVEGRLDCTSIEAHGGNGGGNTDNQAHGPGGGGGGGVVLVQADTLACTPTVFSGLAGTAAGATGGGSHGATPALPTQSEHQGSVVTVEEGFAAPEAPVFVQPAEDATTGPRPRLEGTAQPGGTVHLFLDEMPLGSVVVSPLGTFSFELTADLALGPHQVRGLAERLGLRGATSEPHAFTVGQPSPLELAVGCGCGATSAAGGAGLALVALLLGGMRRRRAAP